MRANEIKRRYQMLKLWSSETSPSPESNKLAANNIYDLCQNDAYFATAYDVVPECIHTLGYMYTVRSNLTLLGC